MYATNNQQILLPIILGSFLLYRNNISETLLIKMKLYSDMKILAEQLVEDFLYNVDKIQLKNALTYFDKESSELSILYKSIIYFHYFNYEYRYLSQYFEEKYLRAIDDAIKPMSLSHVLEKVIDIKKSAIREKCIVYPHGERQYTDLKQNRVLKPYINIFVGAIVNNPIILDENNTINEIEKEYILDNDKKEIEATFLNLTHFMFKNKVYGSKIKESSSKTRYSYLILHKDFEIKSEDTYISNNIYENYYTVFKIKEVSPITFIGPQPEKNHIDPSENKEIYLNFPEPKISEQANILSSIMPLDKKYLGLHMLSTGFTTKINGNYFVGSFSKINSNFKYEKGRIKYQEQIVPKFFNYSKDGIKSI